MLIFSRMPGARVIRFLNHLGEVVAAINLSGPEAVMDDTQAQERFRQQVLLSADLISQELGAT